VCCVAAKDQEQKAELQAAAQREKQLNELVQSLRSDLAAYVLWLWLQWMGLK
jgi:hypothetical protein